MSDNPNDVAIEAWNTVLFGKFVQFRRVLTDGLTEHGEVALKEHPYPKGARVLDIGCGFGDATQAIAQMVGPTRPRPSTASIGSVLRPDGQTHPSNFAALQARIHPRSGSQRTSVQ